MIKILQPLSLRKLDHDELNLFKEKFDLELKENLVLTSDRLLKNNKVYHSINYTRKGKTNNYTICFLQNNKECYGEALKFFEFNQRHLVLIKKMYENDDSTELNKYFLNEFLKFVNRESLDFFFKYLSNKTKVKLIDSSKIICKCLRIENFITKIEYDFEHD